MASSVAVATDWAMPGGDSARTFQASERIPANPAKLWETKLEAGIYGSPVVRANTVYVAGPGVWALNKIDGKVLWSYSAGDAISATPTLVGDLLAVASKDGTLTALDAKNGTPRWKVKTAGKILSSPAADSDALYFASNDLFLYALDPADGNIRWRYFAEDSRFGGLHASPALDGDRVYIGAKNGLLHAVWRQTGKLAWQTQLGSATYDSPLVAGKRLFVGNYDRCIYALDTATGAIVWRTVLDDWPKGTPVLVGETLYVGSNSGVIYGIDAASGKTGWQLPLGEELRHSLTVGSNMVGVIGTVQGRMIAIDLATQRIVWERWLGDAVWGAPAFADRTLFGATRKGSVTAWR